METSSTNQSQFPPPKVKNILVRYCHPSQRYGTRYLENLRLLKHFPKYYKNLSINITPQNSLLSRVKKIKKLNSFTGFLKENEIISRTHWLSLFKSHQKEVDKLPKMELGLGRISLSDFRKLHIEEMKFFYNITKLSLPIMRMVEITSGKCESFPRSIKHMRRLKRLEISLYRDNYEEMKGIVGKLDKMERLLTNFESLKLNVDDCSLDLQDLFGNKRFMSHLTSLVFWSDFRQWSPFLGNIPHVCRNLRYLSISFRDFFSETTEFMDFLSSIRDLPKLEGVNFRCKKNVEEFLKVFKPQAPLRYLELLLDFSGMDLTTMNFESKDLCKYKNLVQHWEDLHQLETLNLYLVCRSAQMMSFTRILVTMILKKAPKLKSFECLICIGENLDYTPSSYLPFFIDQVPHLYESLERFKVRFCDCYCLPRNVSFNLGALKVFKSLKKIKIKGEGLRFVKIKETISLLEKKKFAKLNLKGIAIDSKKDLKNILEGISKAKRTESNNLKVKLEFQFNAKGEEIKYLNKFCHVIDSVKPIKGLLISLLLIECSEPTIQKMRAVIKRHPGIRNCILRLYSTMEGLEYHKVDGVEAEIRRV